MQTNFIPGKPTPQNSILKNIADATLTVEAAVKYIKKNCPEISTPKKIARLPEYY
jgi:hypothetical protein